NSSQTTTTDWWPRQSKHLVLTALGALDEAIEDAMHIARCAAEEKRQKRLEAEYTHAAQHKRVNESLQIFRESYRRNALPAPVGREAREAPQATDAITVFKESYRQQVAH